MIRRTRRPFACEMPPRGWWCSRPWLHRGPCAARPCWWNLPARLAYGDGARR